MILVAESYYKYLVNQAAFIVWLTRAVENILIFTDDKAALLARIIKNTGQKSSALETVGECKPQKDLQEKPSSQRSFTQPLFESLPIASSSPQHRIEVDQLTQRLHDQAEFVLGRILGEPKEKMKDHYRYGSQKGSLVVTLQGDKRGLWHDFQTREGGNLLHLIAKQSGLDIKRDFKAVLTQAMAVLGISEDSMQLIAHPTQTSHRQLSIEPNKPKILTEAQKHSLHYARQLARESQPLVGTLAERYLREHRGIALEKWPGSFRFHPAIYSRANEAIHPALLVIAKDESNKIQAVQAVFLDENTAAKANVKVQKQTWGMLSAGASVNINPTSNKAGPLYIAEGPETGLSIYTAMPNALIKLALVNFKWVNTLG